MNGPAPAFPAHRFCPARIASFAAGRRLRVLRRARLANRAGSIVTRSISLPLASFPAGSQLGGALEEMLLQGIPQRPVSSQQVTAVVAQQRRQAAQLFLLTGDRVVII